jgi:hypothetical protein
MAGWGARLVGAAIVAMTLGAVTPASAVTVFNLDVISKANIGSGSQGTVTLTQNGLDQIDIAVALAPGVLLVNTGGPHTPFVFNLAASVAAATVTVTSPSTFIVPGDTEATPYGDFTNGINYTGANGGGHGDPGPLLFSVFYAGGIAISDFIANAGGYFFAADVLGTGGNTGSVAANTFVTTVVPIPAGIGLLGAGLAALGLVGWRKRASAGSA